MAAALADLRSHSGKYVVNPTSMNCTVPTYVVEFENGEVMYTHRASDLRGLKIKSPLVHEGLSNDS